MSPAIPPSLEKYFRVDRLVYLIVQGRHRKSNMSTRKINASTLLCWNDGYMIRFPKKHLDALGMHEGSYLRFCLLKDKLVASPLLAGILPNIVPEEVSKKIFMCERKGRQDILFNLRERVRKEARHGAEALSVFSGSSTIKNNASGADYSKCPYCETHLEQKEFIKKSSRYYNDPLVRTSSHNVKRGLYCRQCDAEITALDYTDIEANPWMDPNSLFCSPKLKDIISKDPLPDEQFTSGKMRADRTDMKEVVRRISSTSTVSIPGELIKLLGWHPEDRLDLSVVEGTLVISQEFHGSSSENSLYSSETPNNNQIIVGDAIARAAAN
jgi:antitoxin component of MazEF toxin-antitoxin module